MSSKGNADRGSSQEPSTQQLALPADVSSKNTVGEGDLLLQAYESLGPPTPAIRQRAQRSVQVTRSSSTSGATISEQRLSQQVEIRGGNISGEQYEHLFRTDRPQSTGSSATNVISQSSSFAKTTDHSIVASSRTVDSSARFSLSAQASGAIGSTDKLSANKYASASQLAGSSSQQQISSSSTTRSITTTQSTVASRTQTSSIGFSFSANSGEPISADAARALVEQASAGSSALQLIGSSTTTTTTQGAVGSRSVSSTNAGKYSSTGITGDTSSGAAPISQLRQQLEGLSSAKFQSSSRSASQLVKTTASTTTIGGQTTTAGHQLTIPGTSSSFWTASTLSSSALTGGGDGTTSSSAGPTTSAPSTSAQIAFTRLQSAITNQEIDDRGSSETGKSPISSAVIKTTGSSTISTDSTSTSLTDALHRKSTLDIWTTSPAERAIASKYLDKTFRSTSPSVGASLMDAPSRALNETDRDTATKKTTTAKLIREQETIKNKQVSQKLEERTIEPPMMTSETIKIQATDSEPVKTTALQVSSENRINTDTTQIQRLKRGTGRESDDTNSDIVKEEVAPSLSKESIEKSTTAKLTELKNAPLAVLNEMSESNSDSDGKKNITPKEDGQESSSGEATSTQPFAGQSIELTHTKGAKIGTILLHKPSSDGSANDLRDDKTNSVLKAVSITNPTTSASTNQAAIPIISATTSNVNYSAISTQAKNSTYLPLPADRPTQRSYPKKVFFIIVNEFCERFSYYGLRAVLVLYLRGALNFSDADSTIAFHLFTALCYLTPVMGAILADSIWGKFSTILYLSIVYFFGELVLLIASIFWNSGGFAIGATITGLILIGFGTGGIKPCVGALGGDQFYQHETHWRQTFFSVFYGSINLGALLSMFITPLLRSNFQCVDRTDCFPYAFGLPCILMFIAIIVFAIGKSRYYLVPLPERNVLIAFCQCIWLAFKRKITGHKLPEAPINLPINPRNPSSEMDTSSSNLSVSSSEGVPIKKASCSPKKFPLSEQLCPEKMLSYQNDSNLVLNSSTHSMEQVAADRNHWLYLASDRFETRYIEDFRSVLGAFFLMLPMPIYWALFDQQGSLWTLQATRMDGRVFGTNYTIEPDQMSVLNPLLLLLAIPVFEVVIYPLLGRCNILTSSVQRITAGGLLIALAFVSSALIELRIQQFLPPVAPQSGQANLLLVNGLSDCSLSNPMISYAQIPANNDTSFISSNYTTATKIDPLKLHQLGPLSSKGLAVWSATNATPINQYNITFKLTNFRLDQAPNESGNNVQLSQGCPFGQNTDHELLVTPLGDKAVKLLYLEQGNGKLAYRMFDDSLALPPSGKARVRLLYEFFGSATLAHTHQFYLHKPSLSRLEDSHSNQANLKFHTSTRDGQVIVSQFMDVDVKTKGEVLFLRTNDKLIGGNSTLHKIPLEAGTRNLIMVHQNNATNVDVKHQLLQDNDYRVSVLYQLIPYLLLSMSEVLFCITSLDFSYSMAPTNMKTILLAAYFLTATFGNLLTVAIESLNLFPNLVCDFFFYAIIMVLDMAAFAIMGYYYKPRKLPAGY